MANSETPQRHRPKGAHDLLQQRGARSGGVEHRPPYQEFQENYAHAPGINRWSERASHEHLFVIVSDEGGGVTSDSHAVASTWTRDWFRAIKKEKEARVKVLLSLSERLCK